MKANAEKETEKKKKVGKDPTELEQKMFFPERHYYGSLSCGLPLPQIHPNNPTRSRPSSKATNLVIILSCLPSFFVLLQLQITLLPCILINFVCIYQPNLKHNVICL